MSLALNPILKPESPRPEDASLDLAMQVLADPAAASEHEGAFRTLFDHFNPRLNRFYMLKGLNAATAAELASDTLLRLWQTAPRYQMALGNLNSWVFTIARNIFIDHTRKLTIRPDQQAANTLGSDVLYDLDLTDPEQATVENQLIDVETTKQLAKALGSLPPEQRSVIETVYLQGLSHDAAARWLDLPLGTVKGRIRLALAKLKTLIRDRK